MAVSRYSEECPPPELVESIRERLAGVCAGWPESLFESMIARAAWLEFKYDRVMTDSFRAMTVRASAAVGIAGLADGSDSAPRP